VSQTTENLQISVEEPAAWGRKLVITIPASRVKSERAKVTRQLAKRVRIPGFRKGRVPAAQMEARFGADIDRQTQQQLIDRAFREAVSEKSLDPISEPRVAKVSFNRDSELTFEVAFDIRPEIKLARTGGFRLKRPAVSVLDEEVDGRLEYLRRQQALWKPAERKAEAGDSVEVEITPLGESQEETESQPYRFVLGEGRAIPDVEAAIMTLEPGSVEEFSVRFPDDYHDESMQGKAQQLRIDLKQVLVEELPELDEAFAKSLGEFSDLAALKEAIVSDLEHEKQHEVELGLDQQVMEQIIEANPFQVPDQARPAAEWGIKRTLILQKIAEEQDIDASTEEMQERLQGLASRTGRPVQELKRRLAKTGELRDLERRIVDEKVFKFLREQSEIEEAGS
jgi:trigger factor